MVLRVRPEAEQAYREYHAAVWPEILDMIRQCNIRNYSIYLKDGEPEARGDECVLHDCSRRIVS